MFKEVRLHRILPLLRTFALSLNAAEPIWLPDMTGCTGW